MKTISGFLLPLIAVMSLAGSVLASDWKCTKSGGCTLEYKDASGTWHTKTVPQGSIATPGDEIILTGEGWNTVAP